MIVAHGRAIIALLCALHTACVAAEVLPEALSVDHGGRIIAVTRYAAAGEAPRPGVIVLHGSSGLDAGRAAYAQHAMTLAENGMDAYLVSYFGARSGLGCHCPHIWAETVADVTAAIRRRPEASGRVGLLGFSLGGLVALASARDAGVAALVVFYGYMPPEPRPSTEPWPPLLALHGDADGNVPVKLGRELVERARGRGGRAELVVYPGEPHALSTWSKDHAADAIGRMIAFFRAEL
jgi:carboxymethylenebutenolidase